VCVCDCVCVCVHACACVRMLTDGWGFTILGTSSVPMICRPIKTSGLFREMQ